MLPVELTIFEQFKVKLIDLPVSHIWRGHGSAIFLELGELSPRTRRNGEITGFEGEVGIMIQWSWRLETRQSILCGSWSEDDEWEGIFSNLLKTRVVNAELFGRLPELSLTFSNDWQLNSFSTTDGDPQWCIFHRFDNTTSWISIKSGELETASDVKQTQLM